VRWSKALIPTLKEAPAGAVAPSHQLLLKAGMIRQLGSGAYTYLPLGWRVLNKIVAIVRKGMDDAGAQEMLMPALQPVELWKETGRYQTFGDLLMQLKVGGDQTMALGPTHEEVVTDLARDLIKSYRQLPMTLYQIQTKFRDEPRPRFGVLRTREFLMKDAYSFDANLDQLNQSYDAMYEAYQRIFDECGIPYVVVEAESGPIGGDSSHEFMVPASIGEDVILQCPASGYAANVERAAVGALKLPTQTERVARAAVAPPFEKVATPGKRTIQEVSDFLGVTPDQTAKLMVFLADGAPVGVLIRGDHEANEAKIRRTFAAETVTPADAATIQSATGAPMGFLGPVDLKIPLAVDQSVAAMEKVVVGGNAVDLHLTGVVPGRDFPLDRVADLRNAVAGDPCPLSGQPMIETRGIEVGHVFKLGTKYSKAMGATFLDETGTAQEIIMGCYGIGINRILAAAVEALHDAHGIVWPLAIAPYEVILIPLKVSNPDLMAVVETLERELTAAGIDVLTDDRDHQPGFKFKDADLIGIPLRVVIGERGLKEGKLELKWRHEKEADSIPVEGAGAAIAARIAQAKHARARVLSERRAARAAARNA
jgi:prolyl-tRNA synthetase